MSRSGRLTAVFFWASLIFAGLAVLAPMAHVLETPNKLALAGGLWLQIQQHLYRGWGPFIGAPAEIGALATSLLVALLGPPGRARLLRFAAVVMYVAMIAVFFVFNAPVNRAVVGWTPATLPADWPAYRLQWEGGHALAALFGWLGSAAVIGASMIRPSAASRSGL